MGLFSQISTCYDGLTLINVTERKVCMSTPSNFLKNTTDLIETSLEIKSFIHQQIIDFGPFITPETLIVVIARDPQSRDTEADVEAEADLKTDLPQPLVHLFKHRIAIVLKEDESSIEAEAVHDDIFEAIKIAKEMLVTQLLEIQHEMESSQDRLVAIQNAKESGQIH